MQKGLNLDIYFLENNNIYIIERYDFLIYYFNLLGIFSIFNFYFLIYLKLLLINKQYN